MEAGGSLAALKSLPPFKGERPKQLKHQVHHLNRGHVRKGREAGQTEEWKAGYDAALTAAIRILVERSFTY